MSVPIKTRIVRPGIRAQAGAQLAGSVFLDWWLVLWRNRLFLDAIVRRDVALRYRGSALGIAWLVVVPVASMAAYLFVFGGVFSVRFGGSVSSTAFSIWLGILCWQFLAESVVRSATVLYDNVPFVKRVPFPLGILPAVPVLTAAVGASVSLLLFAAASVAVRGSPPASWAAAPFVLLPFVPLALGGAWFLAAVGAFVRDVRQAVPLGMTLLMFLTPVLYPLSAAPPAIAAVLSFNPLAVLFENVRAVVIAGEVPSLPSMAGVLLGSIAASVAGYAVFRLREWEYADVV